MSLFKNIIILLTLISFFSCAPTTIEKKKPIEKAPEKVEEIEIVEEKKEEIEKVETIKKPSKPEDKIIDFNNIDKIIVFLSDDEILTSLFYDVFIKEIDNFPDIKKIEFIYSIDEIQNSINNSLIIGPTNSKDLFDLPNKLGENTFTISLSNDFSVMNKYADNEIIFVFSSPYQHVEILGDYINSSNSLGVLYKQNEYGLKLFEYFKRIFQKGDNEIPKKILNNLIKKGYDLLSLETFFTSGPEESRAWTITKNCTAPKAAGEIHTDFEKGFIRAETVSYKDFVENDGWLKARESGKMRLEGKDYIVNDGDVLNFRFNT